ncbi:hypothetical protein SRHO_G00067620 [Serrasalmus rhombeus]
MVWRERSEVTLVGGVNDVTHCRISRSANMIKRKREAERLRDSVGQAVHVIESDATVYMKGALMEMH